ncbi:hypothetical protein WJX75_008175 [Coccomyxa subellipsoidea]|uniref:Protein kinase domain-containing protein n=1 Tax=Coccomyxa subellipsoidea TaxID=248742 RepID=A0ABR2Z1H8_9CHLO
MQGVEPLCDEEKVECMRAMLRRFVFDVQHLAQFGDSHLLTLYNCASLRNPRALASLEEEGLKCLLPQFPDDLAKFLTQHTKPAKLDSVGAWELMLQYLFEPKHPLRAEHVAPLLANRYRSLQQCGQQGYAVLSSLGMSLDEINPLLRATRQSLCNRAELLLTGLEPPYVSLTSSGRRQVDASRCKYPVSVEAWQDFGKSVLVHRDGLASTQRWFPEAFPDAAKAPAGETSVAHYVNAELVIPINACLRYKALKHEMPAIQPAAWLQQSHHTPTLSEEARQAAWSEQARDAAQDQARITTVLDFGLRIVEVDDNTPKPGVGEMALGELKREERLTFADGQLAKTSAPCMVDIYTKAYTDALTPEDFAKYKRPLISNIIGSLLQVEEYCSRRGIRYFFISCGVWYWFGRYTSGGRMQVAQALRYDHIEPTVREALHYVSHCALTEEKLPKWTPSDWPVNLRYQPPKPKSGSGQGGGSGAGGSGGAEGRGGAGRGAGSGGRSGSKGQGKRGSSPQQGKGVPKSKRSSNKGGGSRGKSRASRAPTTQLDASWRIKADWPALVSTAASFDLDMPETILGSGECGYVFGCRLEGQDAAVKLVPVEGANELLARLRHEAQVYCALRPLWGDKVPALLAAGYGRDRCCYLLATARVGNAPAAEVDLSRADHRALLPAATRALAAIHTLGVLHGDLRADNMLVAPPTAASGSPTVQFVDFGYARCGSSLADRQQEMESLVSLFQQAADTRR